MTDTGNHTPRTAFFAGSFRPFTAGHASIVDRGLRIFDRIVIGIGVNADKPGSQADADARCAGISAIYRSDPRVSVIVYSGLTADAAAAAGACALLRGVRSVHDFEYERDMADINRRLSGIETVLLYSLPEMACLSSSVVRELRSYGRDVTEFLPEKTHTK